jgi:hypothetical protein
MTQRGNSAVSEKNNFLAKMRNKIVLLLLKEVILQMLDGLAYEQFTGRTVYSRFAQHLNFLALREINV